MTDKISLYIRDNDSLFNFSLYVRDDIDFHACLNRARREGRRSTATTDEKNFHALFEGMMAGKIFRNREIAAEQVFPFSRKYG